MRGLADRVALITGAGGGIGAALARRFAAEGCIVGALDIDGAAAGETVAEIDDAGGRAHLVVADITDYDALAAAIETFDGAAGPIAILVNNAGWDRAQPFLHQERASWQKIVSINFFGMLHTHHIVLPGMAERGYGRVVNIASDAARVGSSGEAVYSACKGGMVAFSKTLARELAAKGVTLNAVCPGPTETPLLDDVFGAGERAEKMLAALTRAVPMRRLGKPEDIPGIVAFLASEEAGYITGQTISVSGGLTMHG